jgi:radical SAM superfamily enzyme YgiQ (UPF0313 family)
MRVSLLYPPFLSDNRAFPPLALPALAAYLRERDHVVYQADLNIKAYHDLAHTTHLEQLQAGLKRELANLRQKPHLSLYEMNLFCNLSDATNIWLPFFRREVHKAGESLKRMNKLHSTYLFEKLGDLLALERDNPKPTIEMTSPEMLREIRLEKPSVLNNYLVTECVPLILAQQPDVVGFSVMTESQFFAALTLAHYLKQSAPNIHVTMGGGFVSAVADKIGRTSSAIFSIVDTFVGFDGEHALGGLIERLENGQNFDGVPNLVYFDSAANETRHNRVQETGSLDNLPLPDFEGLDFTPYTSSVLPYYVTKGCAFGKCTYCSDPFYSTARNKSAKKAADEIEVLIDRYKPATLMFVDSYIHPESMEGIATEVIKRNIKMRWLTQTRLDRFLTTERVKLFAESGCDELWFGMETVNLRMIKLIRKGSRKEIITRILEDCQHNNIKVTLNCMIGFPTETEQEANDTINFINALNEAYPELAFKCNTGFVFVPRLAPFGQEPERFGIKVIDEFEWSPRLEWLPPEWRFQEHFMRLEGRIFEKIYRTSHDISTQPVTEDTQLREDHFVDVAEHAYLRKLDIDVIHLWKELFGYNNAVATIQREEECSKDVAVQRLDERLKETGLFESLKGKPRVYAYVIDEELNRKIVPLSGIYTLLLSFIEGGHRVSDVIDEMTNLYKGQTREDVATACLHGLRYLAENGIIQVTDPPLHITPGYVPNVSQSVIAQRT